MLKLNRLIDKSRQVVDLTKIGVKIEKEEANIEKLYANLGRVFYQLNEKSPEIVYDDLFRGIVGSIYQLDVLKKQINIINNVKKCQQCDNTLDDTDLYCAKCGTRTVEFL